MVSASGIMGIFFILHDVGIKFWIFFFCFLFCHSHKMMSCFLAVEFPSRKWILGCFSFNFQFWIIWGFVFCFHVLVILLLTIRIPCSRRCSGPLANIDLLYFVIFNVTVFLVNGILFTFSFFWVIGFIYGERCLRRRIDVSGIPLHSLFGFYII